MPRQKSYEWTRQCACGCGTLVRDESKYAHGHRAELTLEELFRQNVTIEEGSSCWIWKGHCKQVGYGWFQFRRLKDYAHRVAYLLANGPVPEGKSVSHKCNNKLCVNPEHLMLESYRAYCVATEPAKHCACGCGSMLTKGKAIYKPGHWAKTSNGRKNDMARFFAHVDKSQDCWIWTGHKDKHGYGSLSYEGKHWKTHRLSYYLTHGSIPDGMGVLHKCDNPSCVNPDHLFVGTQSTNVADMKSKLRCAYGEKSGTAKLTWQQASEIRQLYVPGKRGSAVSLADQFGVGRQQIVRVAMGIHGKSLCWPEIKGVSNDH